MPPTPDTTLSASAVRQRHAGIDALRAGTTLLVVLHHTAITYGAIGGWFYKEIPADRSISSLLLIFFCTFNQAWFMGLFFLLAGYYTPAALRAKGPWRYLRDRLQRLGIPLLVFGFVLGPVTIALAQTARGKPFADTLFWLWRHGEFEKGPLWFAWALLIFAAFSVAWHVVSPRAQPNATRPLPSNAVLLVVALATGLVAFALRLVWPVGTEAWGLQLGYFASYTALFVAGCVAAAPRWLEGWPAAQVRTWRRTAWWTLPVLPVVALLGAKLFDLPGRPEGGWSVPALVYALWEPLVAWGVILGLLQWCRQRFETLGPLGTHLARRAFAIYVIHPPVVVGVTLAWRAVQAPALVKFAVSGGLACVLCYLIAGALLRVPGVARVL